MGLEEDQERSDILPHSIKMTDSHAAVLALVDPSERVLLCKRAKDLRTHPGEVCLPGGKVEEEDETLEATALRESHEEVGIDSNGVNVKYQMEPISSLAGIWVHAVVAKTQETDPPLILNHDEVDRTAWIPLEHFLSDKYHNAFKYGTYTVHGFRLPQFYVYGLTANLCVLIAMRELQRAPQFDLNDEMTKEKMANLSISEILERFYVYYYDHVRPGERGKGKFKGKL